MKTSDRTYCIVQFLSPSHTKHSGVFTDITLASAAYGEALDAAKADTSIKRVALYRYTSGKTECMNDWMRLGGRACKLRHETPALVFNPAKAA